MKFSVLLSVYKKETAHNLCQSLNSIFYQTLCPAEVVLVKDGLLTSELDYVIESYTQRYPCLKVVALSENRGLGVALNEGLKYCSFEIVARMDTDDIAKLDRFEKQMRIFSEQVDVDVVGAWTDEFYSEISNVIFTRKPPERHDELLKFAHYSSPISHPVAVFRKDAVIRAGGYKHCLLFEDYYLWLRMLKVGCRFYNVQEALLYFRTSRDVVKRRGGLHYAMLEYLFYKKVYKEGLVPFVYCVYNVITHLPLRILPLCIREYIYLCGIRNLYGAILPSFNENINKKK